MFAKVLTIFIVIFMPFMTKTTVLAEINIYELNL
jgi:hypothetical protein